MARDWKPGDVAMLTMTRAASPLAYTPENGAEFVEVRAIYEHGPSWRALVDCDYMWPVGLPRDARPLVVIDPEDREQVCSLVDAYLGRPATGKRIDNMQAVLRDLADFKPPKPEEPTGLGAVVVDVLGGRWVRVDPSQIPWRSYETQDFEDWDHIDAVRVVSQGVTP